MTEHPRMKDGPPAPSTWVGATASVARDTQNREVMSKLRTNETQDYAIRRILNQAWRFAKKANQDTNEMVARAFFAANDAMVKAVEDQGFEVMVSVGGYTWRPKPQPQPEAVQA